MADSQSQTTAGRREIAILVGVLMLVAAGSVATYWARSDDAEASGQTVAAPTSPAPAPTPAARLDAVTSAPITGEVVHADVYFDFKSTRLRADAVRLLQENAALMQEGGSWAVLVQGYADRQGPAEYNRQLAERRAMGVKQFLLELGVPEPSIRVVTIGQEGALCDEPSAECQQLNRRVHLEIRKLTRAAVEPVRPALLVGDTLDTRAGRRQEP
jgi:outer membrane protein OmpA-like peptidoglycan-associated protein